MALDSLPQMISNYPESTETDRSNENSKPAKGCSQQDARAVLQSPGFVELPATELPGGGLLLQAKVIDSFCFVDHPRVELDADREKIVSFSCDCPDWRLDRRFCAHCAALVLGLNKPNIANSAAEAPLTTTDDDEDEFDDDEDEFDDDEFDDDYDFESPELTDLSYRFSNSRYDLYPMTKNPRIPLERFIQVYGDNARARTLHNSVRSWGGSCFGFVSSSTILYESDSGTELSEFDPNALIPSDLQLTARSEKLGMTLHQFIEALQILQHGNYFWVKGTLEELANATEAYQNGDGRPVCMAIWSGPRTNDGHAILPFRLVRTDEAEDILHIYDPNHPLKTRYGYLEKNEAGNYINWRFAMHDHETYASKTGGRLLLGFYDIYKDHWDNRGGNAACNLISVASGTAILDNAGNLLARVTESGAEIFCDDIHDLPVATGGFDGSLFLSVPAGAFRVALEDPTRDELTVQLVGVDLTLDLSTTAREAEVCVDDSTATVFATISEPNARYSAEILNTFGDTEVGSLLNGITAQEGLRLLQKEGQLYANGLTEQSVYCVNEAPTDLNTIGKLIDEPEEKEEQRELIANASSADTEGTEAPKDPQA